MSPSVFKPLVFKKMKIDHCYLCRQRNDLAEITVTSTASCLKQYVCPKCWLKLCDSAGLDFVYPEGLEPPFIKKKENEDAS